MPTLTPVKKELGNLIIREWDTTHTRDQVTITAPAGGLTAYNLFGVPCGAFTRTNDDNGNVTILLAAGSANARTLLIHNEKVTLAAAATSTKRYACLTRGPAVINKNEIASLDPAGGSYNKNDVATGLLAANIVSRAETPTYEVG